MPFGRSAFVSSYDFPDGREIEVARNQDRLVMRYENSALYEFVPMGQTEFFYNAGNDDIVFGLDSSRRVTTLTRYGDGLAGAVSENGGWDTALSGPRLRWSCRLEQAL